jgi:hypothetical protein
MYTKSEELLTKTYIADKTFEEAFREFRLYFSEEFNLEREFKRFDSITNS